MNRDKFERQAVPSSQVSHFISNIFNLQLILSLFFVQKQVWLYYTSKMVTVCSLRLIYWNRPEICSHIILQVFEERPNYDLTQFVADMGGSLGFLLGLSVLGLIKILEKVNRL